MLMIERMAVEAMESLAKTQRRNPKAFIPIAFGVARLDAKEINIDLRLDL